MRPLDLPLRFTQGDDARVHLTFQTSSGPFDLTSYVVSASVRAKADPSLAPLATFTVSKSGNEVTLALEEEATLALPKRAYWSFVSYLPASDMWQTWLAGAVRTDLQAEDADPNDFTINIGATEVTVLAAANVGPPGPQGDPGDPGQQGVQGPPGDRFDYYVSPTGSDSNLGTGSTVPWATLAKVSAAALQPGERVGLLRGGTWAETLTIPASGTQGSPIVFGAYGEGPAPTITGSGTRQTCISGTDKDDVTIQDLNLVGWTQRGIYDLRGDRWTIQRCSISGGDGVGGSPDMGVSLKADTGSYLTGCIVRDNEFGRIGAGSATAAQKTSIFFNGVLAQGVDGLVVERNTFRCIDAQAVTISLGQSSNNTNCIVRDNDISLCRAGILVQNSDDTLVTRNRIHDGRGLGIGVAFSSLRTTITYNLIHDLAGGPTLYNGIDISGGAGTSSLIAHNTIFRVARHCITFATDNGGPGSGWTVQNNILDASQNYQPPATGVDARRLPLGIRVAGLTVTHDHNLFYGYPDPTPTELVTNGSFETFTGTADDGTADTFTGWTQTPGTGSFQAVTATDTNATPIPAGTTALKFVYVSGATNLKQNVTLEAGKTYRVTWKGKSTGGRVNFGVFNSATAFYLQEDGVTWSSSSDFDLSAYRINTTDTSWTTRTIDIVPYKSGTYTLHFAGGAAGTVYLDSVSVLLVPGANRDVISIGQDDGTLYTLAEFQAAFPSSEVGSIDGSPQFVGDFTPSWSSPVRAAGVAIAGVNDNPPDGTPDIGAWPILATQATTP